MKINKSQIRSILKAPFPEYKGRTFKVEFAETVMFHDTNWGGGTKNTYAAIATDGRTARLNVPAPWFNTVEGARMTLPLNILVVEHTVFCGKDLGITIYAHPAHMPKWLPAEV